MLLFKISAECPSELQGLMAANFPYQFLKNFYCLLVNNYTASVLFVNQCPKTGGEGGIRTLGTGFPVQRFSKPAHSATLAPLRIPY